MWWVYNTNMLAEILLSIVWNMCVRVFTVKWVKKWTSTTYIHVCVCVCARARARVNKKVQRSEVCVCPLVEYVCLYVWGGDDVHESFSKLRIEKTIILLRLWTYFRWRHVLPFTGAYLKLCVENLWNRKRVRAKKRK